MYNMSRGHWEYLRKTKQNDDAPCCSSRASYSSFCCLLKGKKKISDNIDSLTQDCNCDPVQYYPNQSVSGEYSYQIWSQSKQWGYSEICGKCLTKRPGNSWNSVETYLLAAEWHHRTWSTLVQVMVCCLMAPSHYLNQCWLIICKVQWHSEEHDHNTIMSGESHNECFYQV